MDKPLRRGGDYGKGSTVDECGERGGVYGANLGKVCEGGGLTAQMKFLGEVDLVYFAIRTLLVHPDKVQMQLGGAIVIDSDPVKEFEETMHKGRSLISALGAQL